jgi:hypothetical protein
MDKSTEVKAPEVSERANHYRLSEYIGSVILVQGPGSTYGQEVTQEFGDFLVNSGIPFVEVETDKNPQLTEERIIDAYDALNKRHKDIGHCALFCALFLATGDGGVDSSIKAAHKIGAAVCALRAGGASNFNRSSIDAKTPEELFQNGFVVDAHTMAIELSRDGEVFDQFEALTTLSRGFTVNIAEHVNSKEHREKTLLGINLHKKSALVAAIPHGVKEIKRAKKFIVEIDGQEVKTRAIMFLNVARFAIIGYAKQVKLDGPAHEIRKSSRSLLDYAITLFRFRIGHSPGRDLKSEKTIRFPDNSLIEIGGETRLITKDTIIRLSDGEPIPTITDKAEYLPLARRK